MANVKPGDRAVVVGGSPRHHGKIVLVLEQAFDRDPMRAPVRGVLVTNGELGWWVRSLGSPFLVGGATGVAAMELPFADAQLRRLVDPDADETETQDKLMPQEVS